jgi:hypothetical protein
MKDFLLFVKWKYSKLEGWQKIYILNFFVMGFTAFRTDPVSTAIFYFTIFLPFAFMCKWFLIDTTISSWHKFKREKAELFTTIKDGK